MISFPKIAGTWLAVASLLFLAACSEISARPTDEPDIATPAPALPNPIESNSLIPDPNLPLPSLTLTEEPLEGIVPEIPDIIVVFREQSQEDLATHLKTSPEQLLRRNPGLPDPVPVGTIVVIPFVYEVQEGETLSSIADKTGLPEEQLMAANPTLASDTALPGDAKLIVRLRLVHETVPLSAAIANTQTTTETLLSANPDLLNQAEVEAGSILVIPPETGGP